MFRTGRILGRTIRMANLTKLTSNSPHEALRTSSASFKRFQIPLRKRHFTSLSLLDVDLEKTFEPQTFFEKFLQEYLNKDLLDTVDYFETFKKSIDSPEGFALMIERCAANERFDLMEKYFEEMQNQFPVVEPEMYSKILLTAWQMNQVSFGQKVFESLAHPTKEQISLYVKLITESANRQFALTCFEKFEKNNFFSHPQNIEIALRLLSHQHSVEATSKMKQLLEKFESEEPKMVNSDYYSQTLLAIANTEKIEQLLSFWDLTKRRGRVVPESYVAFAQSLILLKSRRELEDFLPEIEAGLESIRPSGYSGILLARKIEQLKQQLRQQFNNQDF